MEIDLSHKIYIFNNLKNIKIDITNIVAKNLHKKTKMIKKNKEKVYLIFLLCHANKIEINIVVSGIHFHYLHNHVLVRIILKK